MKNILYRFIITIFVSCTSRSSKVSPNSIKLVNNSDSQVISYFDTLQQVQQSIISNRNRAKDSAGAVWHSCAVQYNELFWKWKKYELDPNSKERKKMDSELHVLYSRYEQALKNYNSLP